MTIKQLSNRYGSRKVLDITIPDIQETLLGTPETLPTTEPGTAQVSYTLSSLLSFSFPVYNRLDVVCVYAAGKAVTAATISWRMKRNGTSIATGSFAVAANTFYTISAFFLPSIAPYVGDVYEIALWSNQTDSNWDFKGLALRPSRFTPTPDVNTVIVQVSGTVMSSQTFTLGSPVRLDTWAGYYPYHHFSASKGLNSIHTNTSTFTGVPLMQVSSFINGFTRLYYGDYSSANTVVASTNAANHPQYALSEFPTQFSWRVLR